MKILNTLQFGVKSYFKNGPLETFKKIRFGKVSKFGKDSYYDERCDDLENGLLVMFLLIIIIVSVAYAFLAVEHISTSRNIRLGMYTLLLLTGGNVAWMYILMWFLKIKV